jgi:1,4-alpha-glucan branching enzyme
MVLATRTKSKRVTFTLNAPDAKKVTLGGDFNNWDYKRTPLQRNTKDRTWEKELTLAPGRYEYKFMVDGNWVNDPSNNNRVRNSFGTENSVIEIR